MGRVQVPVEYKGLKKKLPFYICPYLEQRMYLGIDFCRWFGITRSTGRSSDNRQEAVKKKFLAFEEVGLGKTSVEKHKIQLVGRAEPFKDRYYPQSPAIQQVVYAEVDKMLRLGVILAHAEQISQHLHQAYERSSRQHNRRAR